MTPLRTLFPFLIVVLSATARAGDDDRAPAPLFASSDILDVTIRAPFTTIMRQRSLTQDQPATLTYHDATGGDITIDLGVRTRGRFRQQSRICPWAPLRLNFKKSAVKKTIFASSDKLKLVTHCRNGSRRYTQALLSEYLAYRIFNVVTDKSFRVRLLRVTYVDSDKNDRQHGEFAFLIEHRDQLGKRIGMPANNAKSTEVGLLDPAQTNLGSVFQYLIGNTDFSPIRAAEGEPCCHNNVLFGKDPGRILAIPYDFDMSGLVDAPHAESNPRFKLHSVRQRLYRGRCYNNAHIGASVRTFLEHKRDIYDLVASNEYFDKANRKTTKRFLNDFFAVIENPKKIESRFVRQCVPGGRPR